MLRDKSALPGVLFGCGLKNYNGPGIPVHSYPGDGVLRNVAKSWRLLPYDRDGIERLGAALRLPPIVAQLLLNRNLSDPHAARRFLEAPLNGLHPPDQLPGVAEAADRLLKAVRDGRRICVYGDYD